MSMGGSQMITKIANKLTIFLVNREIISREDIPIYIYGYEALIASLVNFILIVILGVIFHQGWHSIVFFVVFALTRVHSGGYHAQSYLKCNLVLALVYIVTIMLTKAIIFSKTNYIVVFVLFYLSVILKFAPVPDSKKQISKAEEAKFREKILLLSAIWTILILILSFVCFRVALTMAITLFVVAVLIVIQQLLSREEEIYDEEST